MHVPIGLATKLGAVVAALLDGATVIQAFLAGDHTSTTIATIAGLVVTVYKIMDGRYNQATAAAAAPMLPSTLEAGRAVLGRIGVPPVSPDEDNAPPEPFTADDLDGRQGVSSEMHIGLADPS